MINMELVTIGKHNYIGKLYSDEKKLLEKIRSWKPKHMYKKKNKQYYRCYWQMDNMFNALEGDPW